MQWPSLDEFRELRRSLPVVAAVLFVAALAFPMWVIYVQAPQYPGEVLTLKLYAYPRLTGDYWEMAELNQYVGFYYPDPVYWEPNFRVHDRAINVPEWSFGWLAFVLVSALSLFVALAPSVEKLKRGLKWQLIGTVTVFTVMLIDIQYRLYQAGHSLDPDAPLMGVEAFTPPIWGKYEVANITSHSRFGSGVYLVLIAIGLLVVAYYYRDSTVTYQEFEARVRARIATVIGSDTETAGSETETVGSDTETESNVRDEEATPSQR
ncbi:hypothetical protein ACERIT_09380 [Halopenitus sp. H-Gu1]|uniref:hypothetical protein n=1 Tax=Halopenitus sp. H-Gu1 TaxID=3242697 RepID=UPI00359E9CAB